MSITGSIREKLFGISLKETSVEYRGFQLTSKSASDRAELIGRTFVYGYHAALREGPTQSLADTLDQLELEIRGFCYEGVAMGLALLDYLTPWNSSRFNTFLHGPGAHHCYMLHVGAGWAMARLPWNIESRLTKMDPLLRWLAIDGYGFHEGYFNWRKSVSQQHIPRGLKGYSCRAYDQGLGRSLWFVKGGNVESIAEAIGTFPVGRQADQWSGIGLAAAYAGGVERSDIVRLLELAQGFRPELAQGVAFACKARQTAGNPAPHTEMVSEIICQLTADDAAQLTDDALPGESIDLAQPAYEVWRQDIQNNFR